MGRLTLLGAGKAATSFDPSSIAGLQVWLKDSGLAGADTDPIATWTNAGAAGAAGNFTQALAGNRPIKKTAVLNGHDIARFDGSNDNLASGNLSAVFPSAATLFVVATISDTTYDLYVTRTAGDGFWRFSDGAGYWDSFRSARVNTYPAAMPSTGSHYFASRSSAAAYQAWVDGVAQTAKTAAYASGTTHTLGTGGNGGPFTGDIAEVLVYDSALSDADMLAVHTYLAARFGL